MTGDAPREPNTLETLNYELQKPSVVIASAAWHSVPDPFATHDFSKVGEATLIQSSPQRSFPQSTISELQRWGQFIEEPRSRSVKEFWQKLCVYFNGPPLPVAMPGAESGTMQLAWDTDELHLDVSLGSSDTDEWFFMNRKSGELQEGSVDFELTKFVGLLKTISQ